MCIHTLANPYSLIESKKYSLEALSTDALILKRTILTCLLFLLSPGFYELSDGGSCSLSNSCVSVYSECLSSSQTSLLHPSSPANSHINPLAQVDVCRQRSADESTTQLHPPRAGGHHLGSSRIRANTEQKRPRPVSTGKPITYHIISSHLSMKLIKINHYFLFAY